MHALVTRLNEVPLAGLMLVVAVGYTLGRVSLRGVSIGPAGGTLVTAILLGHFGLSLTGLYGGEPPSVTIGLFGFSLFIYSVGFEAGPRFFASLRGKEGWRYVSVAAGINLLALGISIAAARALGFDSSTAAGLLAGALTSAPAYAAASEVAPSSTRLSVAFAIAYPVGLVGLAVAVQLLPRLIGVSPKAEDEGAGEEDGRRLVPEHGSPELTRVFEVSRPGAIGRNLRQLDLTHVTGCVVSSVRRGEWFEVATAETVLEEGDRLLVTGRVDELRRFEETIGTEVYDERLAQALPERRILVTRGAVEGKSLSELGLTSRLKVVISSIESGSTLIEPTAEASIHVGDVVVVAGSREALAAVASELGRFEPATTHTDVAIYAGGIFLGVLLGSVHLDSIGIDFSLGLAGGLLLTGVTLGRLQRLGPLSANVPAPARQLVRDLGILLFVAETGLSAGEGLGEVGGYDPAALLAASLVVVVLPVVLMVLAARLLFHLDPPETWGSVSGGMTSSAALTLVKRSFGSNKPAVSYAAAYAIASVLVTVAGQLVVLLS